MKVANVDCNQLVYG